MKTAVKTASDFRVIVTGSRHWSERTIIEGSLSIVAAFVPGFLVVVHGWCPTGADKMADDWALAEHSLDKAVRLPERFKANWGIEGNQAGGIRNQRMVNAGADLCLGFPLPGSVGTFDCMRRAQQAGITTINMNPLPPVKFFTDVLLELCEQK